MDSEERLGREGIWKLMFSMGIPTFIGHLVHLLYNIVDRIFIGHIEGTGATALTGVGLCFPIITLIIACSNFVGAGGAPLAAISLGKGERHTAEKILANGLTMLLFFSVTLTALFYIIKKPFLYAFGASDSTYPFSESYLNIYLLGTVFTMLSMGLIPFLNAQGKAKVTMLSALLGAVINIALDPIMIFALHLGIRGAAYATVFSQAVSAAIAFFYLVSDKATLRIKAKLMAPDFKIIGKIASLGISPFIMSATESLITVVFNRGALLYGNDLYVGSITILNSVCQMIFTPINGFTQGVQPIISYNYGAGKPDRVKTACLRLIAISFSASLIMATTAILLPGKIAGLFTNNQDLIAICIKVLPIYLAGMTVFGLQTGCQPSFMALGQAKNALFFALFRKVILLTPLALILPEVMGSVTGLYLAEPISDALSAILCITVFLKTLKRILDTEMKNE
ncbi:MAG: MATE family efflux transporter [Clostridia bacterium]|nr:MATE family efflux transporter [Clostridia bacterium]